MLQEDNVLPRATELPFSSALHAKNDITNLFDYKLGQPTENSTFYFSSQIRKQFKLLTALFYSSHYAVVCEVINL